MTRSIFAVLLAACNGALAASPDAPTFRLGDAAAPNSYEWHVSIDPEADHFDGDVRIAVHVARAISILWLNAEHLEVAEARRCAIAARWKRSARAASSTSATPGRWYALSQLEAISASRALRQAEPRAGLPSCARTGRRYWSRSGGPLAYRQSLEAIDVCVASRVR